MDFLESARGAEFFMLVMLLHYDTETELYYLQSRYYNPEVGRFINADTTESFSYLYDNLDLNLFLM